MLRLVIIAAAAFFALVAPAEARHRHGYRHTALFYPVRYHRASRRYRHRRQRGRAGGQIAARLGVTAAAVVAAAPDVPWIKRAAAHLGGNPTGWRALWCGKFVRMMVPKDPGSKYDWAANWKDYGKPSPPKPGAIAVLRGHVGFVYKDLGSSVVLISGNYNRRVGIGTYPKSRFIAFRWPQEEGGGSAGE